MDQNYREVRRTLIIVLVLNLFVTISKAVFGILSNSLSMIADAVHSLFDSSSNIVGLFAIKVAEKPPDSEHPYGHRKYEIFATLIIALMLLLTSLEILMSAIDRINNFVKPEITSVTFAVMIITLIVNWFVSRYEHKKGEVLHSSILVADSMHTKSDIYASLSVLAGFIAVNMGHPLFDSIVALLLVLLIGRTGYSIIKEGSVVLVDTCVVDSASIRKIVKAVPGVEDCHKIRTRGCENEIYADLHITLDPKLSLEESHRISHQVEAEIKDKIKGIKDVVVHTEPKN